MPRMISTLALALATVAMTAAGAHADSENAKRKSAACFETSSGSVACVPAVKKSRKVYAAGYDIVPERYLNGGRFPSFDLFRPVR